MVAQRDQGWCGGARPWPGCRACSNRGGCRGYFVPGRTRRHTECEEGDARGSEQRDSGQVRH
eukprot:759627-Hanusia_phi.AAC.1